MKRLAWLMGVLLLALAACTPSTGDVQSNVVPIVISTSPRDGGETLLIQGRYLGDGENDYVVVGADRDGRGGFRAPVRTWSANRIEVAVPDGLPGGYVFVVVDGVYSSGLTVNF